MEGGKERERRKEAGKGGREGEREEGRDLLGLIMFA